MLINFKVKNFRSIKDEVTLDLQATSDKTMVKQSVFEDGNLLLLKSAGIYGPNASGKSNIFKAFMVFKKMILESLARSNMPDMLPNECFKLSSSTENKPSFFEITFVMDDEVFVYGLNDSVDYNLNITNNGITDKFIFYTYFGLGLEPK